MAPVLAVQRAMVRSRATQNASDAHRDPRWCPSGLSPTGDGVQFCPALTPPPAEGRLLRRHRDRDVGLRPDPGPGLVEGAPVRRPRTLEDVYDVTVRAGATLLYDSEPEAEYAETEAKARAFLEALDSVE